ncbi:MAG: hypothetical protein IGBAC_2000 [Ignavibacteriae bacterium]|nr:MAG: hypothetical protein IGBAC_2000 [Ignavibacteriota bacterium]
MGLATKDLIQEHEVIRKALNILSNAVNQIDKQNINRDLLLDLVEFFKIFADKCHHGKEEQYLFEAMVSKGFSKESGPIAVMLSEHTLGRSFVRNMAEALREEGDSSINKFKENALQYIDLLNQHIDKENNILFVMADRVIMDEEQEELYKQYVKFENENIGEQKIDVKNKLNI